MILATIEFPNGSRINFGKDGRWTRYDVKLPWRLPPTTFNLNRDTDYNFPRESRRGNCR